MLRDSVAMLLIMTTTAMMMMTIAVMVIMMVMMMMEVCTCVRRLVSVPTSGPQLMSGLFDLKHYVGHNFVCECTYFTQIVRSSVPIGTILQCILLEKLMLYIQGTYSILRTYICTYV